LINPGLKLERMVLADPVLDFVDAALETEVVEVCEVFGAAGELVFHRRYSGCEREVGRSRVVL
jgi:hypothetical protein